MMDDLLGLDNEYFMRVLDNIEGEFPDYLQNLKHPATQPSLPLPRRVLYKDFDERWKSAHEAGAGDDRAASQSQRTESLCDGCRSFNLKLLDSSNSSKRREDLS